MLSPCRKREKPTSASGSRLACFFDQTLLLTSNDTTREQQEVGQRWHRQLRRYCAQLLCAMQSRRMLEWLLDTRGRPVMALLLPVLSSIPLKVSLSWKGRLFSRREIDADGNLLAFAFMFRSWNSNALLRRARSSNDYLQSSPNWPQSLTTTILRTYNDGLEQASAVHSGATASLHSPSAMQHIKLQSPSRQRHKDPTSISPTTQQQHQPKQTTRICLT